MSARCCALKSGHFIDCAWFCSICVGSGRDDELGGDPCPTCDGLGWFNDAGEPCFVHPSELAPSR